MRRAALFKRRIWKQNICAPPCALYLKLATCARERVRVRGALMTLCACVRAADDDELGAERAHVARGAAPPPQQSVSLIDACARVCLSGWCLACDVMCCLCVHLCG